MNNRIFFTALFLFVFAAWANAQKMHVILVINTEEAGRNTDRSADYEQMRRFWEEAAQYTGVQLSLTHLGNRQFYSGDVLRSCQNINATSKDIVIFYFSGHGANDRSSKWPIMALHDKALRMSDVVRTLREKNPKFLMVMADCCNSHYNSNALPPVQANPQDAKLYKDLFLNFKGKKQILVSASSPGEYSYSHLRHGSYWGICFREAFRRAADNSNRSIGWQQLLESGKTLAGKATSERQTAQFEIIIPADASED